MVLVGIDGGSVVDMEPSEISKVILGPPGSPVNLRFKDPMTGRVHLIATRREFSMCVSVASFKFTGLQQN